LVKEKEAVKMAEIDFYMLEVDLTNMTSKKVDVTTDVKIYSAARGLANKLIWDMVPQGTDLLGPQQILHLGVGPLTGLLGGHVCCSHISPLTGWVNRALSGGTLGAEMLDAGYNCGILLKGKADKPVYLYVYDDKVEIRDASDLWGLTTTKTNARLQDRLFKETGEIFSTATIGPAGENLVRYANIVVDGLRSANKRGPGATMGSKNLKAVVVRGTKGRTYADHQKVWELLKTMTMNAKNMNLSKNVRLWGINEWTKTYYSNPSGLKDFSYGEMMSGIKNNHTLWVPECDNYNYKDFVMRYKLWSHACPGCPNACNLSSFRNLPAPLGASVGKHVYDNSGACALNWMLKTYEEQSVVATALEELGMDGEEIGGIIAWAMDLYEHGIISQADLDGIDLKWGDLDAALGLLKKIAHREGKAPSALADGFLRAEKVFGDESIWYAYEVHGCAMDTQDMRTGTNRFRYPSNHTGARKGESRDMSESLTQCAFLIPYMINAFGSWAEAVRLFLNAACGWNMTIDDVWDMNWRYYFFNRAISHREGFNVPLGSADVLPIRAYTETVTDKYGTKYMVDESYWRSKEWPDFMEKECKLNRDGSLRRSELVRLGLDFVIPVLDPLGVIGP
jgi:aldehyde:ferredoxin oxidoreductase